MPKLIILISVFFIMFASACDLEPSVSFTEPLPPNKNESFEFGNRILGTYENNEKLIQFLPPIGAFAEVEQFDSLSKTRTNPILNQITVTATSIEHRTEYRKSLALADARLDSGFSIDSAKQEVLIDGGIFKWDDDSVYGIYTNTSTIFEFDSVNILKKHKGWYFLNYEFAPYTYVTYCMFLDKKNKLVFAQLNSADVQFIKENFAAEPSTDSESESYEPSEKQLKRFLKDGGFGDRITYYRVR